MARSPRGSVKFKARCERFRLDLSVSLKPDHDCRSKYFPLPWILHRQKLLLWAMVDTQRKERTGGGERR